MRQAIAISVAALVLSTTAAVVLVVGSPSPTSPPTLVPTASPPTPTPPPPPPPPTPTPDPLAACQRDPANLPPLPSGTTFHTCGSRIFSADGQPVQITGVSWFGMETGTYAPHGLWTRNWKAMLDQIAALGFNSVRIPFSNEAVTPGRIPQNINYSVNPDLSGKTSLDMLDLLIQGAADRGLKVILDRHRPTAAAQSDLWYTDAVSESRWISDWQMLAQRYKGQAALLGMDLHNEPRGAATWDSGDVSTDWRMAAERAGNAILEVNPYLLIFIQGVEKSGDDWYWWGGNFLDARSAPVELDIPGRVVYSPHDYGPDVYPQPWFSAPDFPNNLPAIWDSHWGYLANDQIAPVVLGEFGGSVNNAADGSWQRALMDYAQQHRIGWLSWAFNPDSGDTGGLLADDWLSVVQSKADLYQGHLAAPLDVGASGVFGAVPTRLSVQAHTTTTTPQSANLSFALQLVNDGPSAVDLSQLEVRYWFNLGAPAPGQEVNVDYAAVGAANVRGSIDPSTGALRLGFAPGAGSIAAYASTGEIDVRIHRSNWSPYDQHAVASFGPKHAGLYRSGSLIWGTDAGDSGVTAG